MIKKWAEVLTDELLTELGKGCGTLEELAAAVQETTGKTCSGVNLHSGHKRNRAALGLKTSLMEYMGRGASPTKPKPPKPGDIRFSMSPERAKTLHAADRFVVTCALNNSPVNPKVWASLKGYADRNAAQIVVLPVRYKNPTNRVDGKIIDEGAWWPEELHPYMTDDLHKLHEHCWAMGHVRIQATASSPLTGLESLSKSASAVFGHPQLAMQMVPTPQNRLPKVLYTSGTVSEANYSETKAGIKGDHHHTLGAVVVESNGARFHIRALVADDDGGVYDVDRYYHPKGSRRSKGALGLVTGDEHALFSDPKCKAATYLDKNSIVKVTRPAYIVRHDVFDGYSISHHGRENPVTQIAKHQSGRHLVQGELELTLDHIDSTTPKGVKNLIVSSNHHDHLLQWMRETTPIDEPWNAGAWIDLWGMLKDTITSGPGGAQWADPLALWMAPRCKSDTEFLMGDSGRMIGGYAVDMHGHRGSNGSRGSLRQFTKIGVKSIIGHSHTPGIMQGCIQVGTSSELKLEYTGGPSSWAHCHAVIHPNGKAQLLFIVDGVWRKGSKNV